MSQIGQPSAVMTLTAGPIERDFHDAYLIKHALRNQVNDIVRLVNPALHWREANERPDQPLGQLRQTIGMHALAAVRGTLMDSTWPFDNPIRFDCTAPESVAKSYSDDQRQEAKSYLDSQAARLWDTMNAARANQRAFPAGRGFRASMSTTADFALGHGDVCCWGQKDFLFEIMRPEQWACVRDGQGNELRLLVRRKIDPNTLPAFVQLRAMLPTGWRDKPVLDRMVWVYTDYIWKPNESGTDGEWVQTDEINGQEVNKDFHDEARIFSVPWYFIPGDNYGRSFFEMVFAAIAEIDHLAGAAAELVNLCADLAIVLDQNSSIRPARLIGPTGRVITGGKVVNGIAQDIGAMSVNKHQDLREIREERRLREEDLKKILGLDIDMLPASKDRTPRLLVEEVSRRLNAMSGGQVLSFTETWTTKVLRCVISIARENKLFDRPPEDIKNLIDDWFDVRLTSGVAGIARANRVQRILAWAQAAANITAAKLPQDIKVTEIVLDMASDMGVPIGNWRMTKAELQQAQQQAVNTQLQADAALETIKATAPALADQLG